MIARLLLFIFFFSGIVFCQPYPDQFHSFEKDSLIKRISGMSGMQVSGDGKSIVLSDGIFSGSATFEPDSSEYPFNRGLPSWNGIVSNDNSSFRVLIRFFNNGTWSKWFTVGYWKENAWSDYGTVKDGGVDIQTDYAVLSFYCKKWQFQAQMSRSSLSDPSPSLHKLSFFVSDQQTTDKVNYTTLLNDKPEAVFIPTQHFYQYALDPGIGGNICSPTTVSMILRSYNISVDPLQFAKDNYDKYWAMFGVWPRVVENAVKYGLNGSVTRYRTWSEARKVLVAGGRIGMSVGLPLYSGHLMMLAGFDSDGNPIVHDPAKSAGYSYKFDKNQLAQSWFGKGGIAYTFFLDNGTTASVEMNSIAKTDMSFSLSNYPNPFNAETIVRFETPQAGYTTIKVYDITGRVVEKLFDDMISPGAHILRWNASDLPTGNYFIHVLSGSFSRTIKTVLLK